MPDYDHGLGRDRIRVVGQRCDVSNLRDREALRSGHARGNEKATWHCALASTGLLLAGYLAVLLGAKVASGKVEFAGFALMACSITPAILYARANPPQP
jgi:uncharacterized membrane protein YhdT